MASTPPEVMEQGDGESDSDTTITTSARPDRPCGKRIPHGRRCLVNLVDARAKQNHGRPYASIPISRNVQDGFTNISYRRLANAVNRCAGILIASCGPSTTFQPIIYLGPSDLTYQILALAAPKAGYSICFPSPRNNTQAMLDIVDQSAARFIASPTQVHPLIKHCLQARSLDLIALPDLLTLLDEDQVVEISFEHDAASITSKPWVHLQTLDVLGRNDLTTLTQGFASSIDAWSLLAYNDDKYRYAQKDLMCAIPCFHVAGLVHSLVASIWLDSTVILPPALPVVPDVVHATLQQMSVAAAILPVSVVSAMVARHEQQGSLLRLQSLTYIGGSLPESAWDYLSSRVALTANFATAEIGALPMLPSSPAHRNHVRFNDEYSSMQFRTPSSSGTVHELVLTRTSSGNQIHPVFTTFPEISTYPTKLFFLPHSKEQGMWRLAGRDDATMTLSDGQDFSPIVLEHIIANDPRVAACTVLGESRTQPCALVELTTSGLPIAVPDWLWAVVVAANHRLPRAAQLARSMILIADSNKPLSRAASTPARRQVVLESYQTEIDLIYSRVEVESQRRDHALDFRAPWNAEMSLMPLLRATLGVNALNSEDNIFERGLDSLQAVSLLQQINSARPVVPLEMHDLYDSPTAAALAHKLVRGSLTTDSRRPSRSTHSRQASQPRTVRKAPSIRIDTATSSAEERIARSASMRTQHTSVHYSPQSMATTAVATTAAENMPRLSVANSMKALPMLPDDEPWTERVASWITHRSGLTELVRPSTSKGGWPAWCGCFGRGRR